MPTNKQQRPPRFGFNTLGQVIPVPVDPKFSKRNVTLIAASGINCALGANGQIPWHLPPDMKQFARLTKGHPVIMGRKTYDSLPINRATGKRTLDDRQMIVVTRDPRFRAGEVMAVSSLQKAIEVCGDRQIFIIGGGQIYEQCLYYDLHDDIIHTDIDVNVPNADVFFPIARAADYLDQPYSSHEYEGLKFKYMYLRRRKKETIHELRDQS